MDAGASKSRYQLQNLPCKPSSPSFPQCLFVTFVRKWNFKKADFFMWPNFDGKKWISKGTLGVLELPHESAAALRLPPNPCRERGTRGEKHLQKEFPNCWSAGNGLNTDGDFGLERKSSHSCFFFLFSSARLCSGKGLETVKNSLFWWDTSLSYSHLSAHEDSQVLSFPELKEFQSGPFRHKNIF